MFKKKSSFVYIFISLLISSNNAEAYIDPGTASGILQIISGFVATIIIFFSNILNFFKNIFKKKKK
jgi:hypothetical protein